MAFFDFLDFLKPYKPPLTGYVQDSEEWIKSLEQHDVAGGSLQTMDWTLYAPPFRSQEQTMMCTAFSACSALYMLMNKNRVDKTLFSPLELFTRSGGQTWGNSLQNVSIAMQKVVIPESVCPWVGPVTDWNPYVLKLMSAYASNTIDGKQYPYYIKGFNYVQNNTDSLRAALATSPLIAIVNVGRGYFDNPAPAVTSGALHAVVIVHVEDDGRIKIFDSLTQTQGFDGFHYLSPGFQINSAYSITISANPTPLNAPTPFDNVLNRYGKAQDKQLEAKIVLAIKAAIIKNPTHKTYLESGMKIYTNAIAYGGYTLVDVLNDITSQRRNQGRIFDLNFPKKV